MSKRLRSEAGGWMHCGRCNEVHQPPAEHVDEDDDDDDGGEDDDDDEVDDNHDWRECDCVDCLVERAPIIAFGCLDDCMVASSAANLVGGDDAHHAHHTSIIHAHAFAAQYTLVLVRGRAIPSLDGIFEGEPCGNNDLVVFLGEAAHLEHEVIEAVRERVARSPWTEAAFATCAVQGRTAWVLAAINPNASGGVRDEGDDQGDDGSNREADGDEDHDP